DLRLRDDAPEPACPRGHVVVEMAALGICGTDLGYYDGDRSAPRSPWVLGHEGIGRIVRVGDGVDSTRVGERVAIEPNFPCGTCEPCASGLTSLCRNRGSLALTQPGLLAERVAIRADFAWPLPDATPDIAAVCIEPLAVAQAAIRRAALSDADSRVLVIGAGAQGLLLIEALTAAGRDTAVLDPHKERTELARQLGARQPAENESFSVAFETSGSAAGGSTAVERLAPSGRAVFVGLSNDPLPLSTLTLVRNGLTVTGSMIYDHPYDFAATIAAVVSGGVHPERVLGRAYPFERSDEAFADARTNHGKTWIFFGEKAPDRTKEVSR
ncbi:zinc-dependent alcohol dehydrogenase, partial [Microbacterium sp.]|uniref:zinc-dependent alcohol dehydrogenase n=1 Tax=Microbacterium sp. TaxID=51671 RepID=UPI003F9CEA01